MAAFFLPGTRAFENSVAVESWLLVNTEFPSVTVTSFMNIKQTLHEVSFCIKQQLKISLKMWRHLFWQPFIDLTYADVFSMHTVWISFWACTLVTATWTVTETQTNWRGIFLFTFSYLSVVLYTKITKNMNLRNILINMTKKKVNWNICRR